MIVAIDLGSSSIVGVVGMREGDRIKITAVERVPSEGAVRRGCVVNVDEAASRVRKLVTMLENKLSAKIEKTYVAIAGQSVRSIRHTASRHLPEGTVITENLLADLYNEGRNFSIANAEWLVANPEKSPYAWTALQGVMILPVASILFIVGAGPFGMLDTSAGLLGPAPVRFLLVLLMLGTLCSWLAMICWNSMSQRLPSALSGQLIVFESIFAVVYALIYRGETPALTMIAGFIVLLVGVLGSLRAFRMPLEPHGPKKTHPVRAAQ